MVEIVNARDQTGRETFLDGNYLSTERRVPLDVIDQCLQRHRDQRSVGRHMGQFHLLHLQVSAAAAEVTVNHPVSGAATPLQSLGNGRGYLRPASLVSLWSTAPFLLNNAVGHEEGYYGPDYYNARHGDGADYGATCPAADPNDPYLPCVENRLKVFEHSIRQMLSPAERRTDRLTAEAVPGYIYRTSAPSCLKVPAGSSPTSSSVSRVHSVGSPAGS